MVLYFCLAWKLGFAISNALVCFELYMQCFYWNLSSLCCVCLRTYFTLGHTVCPVTNGPVYSVTDCIVNIESTL